MRNIYPSAVFFAVAASLVGALPAVADPNPCVVTGPPFAITCAPGPTTIPAIVQSFNGGTGDGGSVGLGFPFPIPPTDGDSGGAGGSATLVFPVAPGSQAIELPPPPAAISIESLGGTGGDGGGAAGYPFGGGRTAGKAATAATSCSR